MNNISFKTKLLLLLFVPLLLFASTAVYLLQLNSSNIGKLTRILYETSNRSTTLVLNADRDMYQALSAYQKMQSAYVTPADKESAHKDLKENVSQANDRIGQALEIIKEQGLTGLTHDVSGKSIESTIKEVTPLFNNWEQQAENHIKDNSFTAESETKMHALFEEARGNINEFGEILESYTMNEVSIMKSNMKQTNVVTYSAMIAGWILLSLFGMLLIRKVSHTVALVQTKTKQVSEGDLKYSPQKKYDKDELGQILFSVDSMIGKMRELISSIADNTSKVATASEELSLSAQESAAAATHVAENIQEMTSLADVQSTIAEEASKAMEEMSVGVQRIAESTNRISDHSHQTNAQADQGMDKLQKLREQLEQMMETIQLLNRSIAVLNDKSAKIGAITENITSFANQTGILSLNASIEAARAGEHGRGFAVVAQEIRKLATSSLESAEIINELIADTRGEIGHASEFMRTTVSQSERGTSFMDDVSHGFESIVESIKQVTEQIHDASAVTEQMSASSEEVSASMDQSSSSVKDIAGKAQNVSAATEEQLALVENIAHSAEQLQTIVNNLNSSVRFFKL
ncbi:methyl-accepting chemotaxis protein [Cohnella luojiensis]|uniref:Methyl-accepting chemotaxis protein n=1 Tax=Cohnella luojiensis TaxID=652876 RepID=A0A4Y8LPF9_9BACL|nr:methyl-accepting chemotaxis protein [Cohnella luojiensis]TFE22803.1 methyl-accepting chemotaxis protein [Cohnella luojiensis]